MDYLCSETTVTKLLDTMVNKPNFKARIHAIQTLMKLKAVPIQLQNVIIPKLWEAMEMQLQAIN